MAFIGVEQTRMDFRKMFTQWGIDLTEYEIIWQEERLLGGQVKRLPGVSVRFMREGKWQTVSCYKGFSRAMNLRLVYLFLDRLRIAEKQGVQYQDLTFTKEVAVVSEVETERDRKQNLLEAYDRLGAAPDDDTELIEKLFRAKANSYHPDKPGGDVERFKRLQEAYDFVMATRKNHTAKGDSR